MSRFTTDHPIVAKSSALDTEANPFRWFLLVLAIGGGFTGIVAVVRDIIHVKIGFIGLIFALGFAGLYIFTIASGLLFADNPRCTLPLMISLIFQIPPVSSPMLSYDFGARFWFTVGFVNGHFAADRQLGSVWFASFLQNQPWGIGINLFAVLVLVMLVRYARKANSITDPGVSSD